MKEEINWLLGSDTGSSSKTILSVMTGTEYAHPSVPCDPGDFGRCYRLLEKFPQWKYRLVEVSNKYPEWKKLITDWHYLSVSYVQGEVTGRDELYKMIKERI